MKCTLKEIKDNYVREGSISTDEQIYVSGENWGIPYYGTMDDWKEEIPEESELAEFTGYWGWYQSDDRDISWREYRKILFSELQPVKIEEEDEEKEIE